MRALPLEGRHTLASKKEDVVSSTIQQEFIDSVELRSIDRTRHCGVDLKPPTATLVGRSELIYFLHNRFRLSVRIKNPPCLGSRADQPFSDMNAPCVFKAGIAVYTWKNGRSAPRQVVKHSVVDGIGPENV